MTQQTGLTQLITPKALTYSGLTAPASKVYDGTTTAVVSGTATLLTAEAAGSGSTTDNKPSSGDTVTLTGTATGTYNSKDVATATTVTFASLASRNSNYTVGPAATQAATITPKALTVSGITAGSTTYDGTTTAKLGGTAAFQSTEAAGTGTTSDGKPYSVDAVVIGGTEAGTLAAKDVGTQAVTITGNTVTGTGSTNYTVTQQTGLTQLITARP